MADSGQDIMNQIKAGTLSLEELASTFGSATASPVTISDWDACYSSATNQLSSFCTATSDNSSNPITGIGLILYSGNGAVLYAVQYTNGVETPMIMTSIGTTLYNPGMGNQALGVVYGWTAQSSFYQQQTMTIGNC